MKKYRGIFYRSFMYAGSVYYRCEIGAFAANEPTEQDMKEAIDWIISIVTNLPNAGEEESE